MTGEGDREGERAGGGGRRGNGRSSSPPVGPFACALVLACSLVVVGCTMPSAPSVTTVPPPLDGGGFGECHTTSARTLAVPFRATEVTDAHGRAPGIHRLNASTFLWVWASYRDTFRQDKVARLNDVDVYRESDPAAPLGVCTRAEIAAPTQVDGARRTYDVGAVLEATAGLPPGRVSVLVDWIAGCAPCELAPRGNTTATFDS